MGELAADSLLSITHTPPHSLTLTHTPSCLSSLSPPLSPLQFMQRMKPKEPPAPISRGSSAGHPRASEWNPPNTATGGKQGEG